MRLNTGRTPSLVPLGANIPQFGLGLAGQLGETAHVGEAGIALSCASSASAVFRQAFMRLHACLFRSMISCDAVRRNHGSILHEACAPRRWLRSLHAEWPGRSLRACGRFSVLPSDIAATDDGARRSSCAQPVEHLLVKAGNARLEAERSALLQAFLRRCGRWPSPRPPISSAVVRVCALVVQRRVRALVLLEGKARDLGEQHSRSWVRTRRGWRRQ